MRKGKQIVRFNRSRNIQPGPLFGRVAKRKKKPAKSQADFRQSANPAPELPIGDAEGGSGGDAAGDVQAPVS